MSGVDITYDGHWVLTTSDFYLTIAPTQFKVRASLDCSEGALNFGIWGHVHVRQARPGARRQVGF